VLPEGCRKATQESQSRVRDENVHLTVLTAQVKNKKHMSDCNQIAAEQVPALSSAERAQGSPGSAREANEEVSAIRESPASPGASRFNTEQREQRSGLAMGGSTRG